MRARTKVVCATSGTEKHGFICCSVFHFASYRFYTTMKLPFFLLLLAFVFVSSIHAGQSADAVVDGRSMSTFDVQFVKQNL